MLERSEHSTERLMAAREFSVGPYPIFHRSIDRVSVNVSHNFHIMELVAEIVVCSCDAERRSRVYSR